jgi:glutathione synthase/RimK-type ligase-like ATP-grasp enzyme
MTTPDVPAFKLVNIGAASGPRRESIRTAHAKRTGTPPTLLTWNDVIEAPERLAAMLGPDSYVRLDSPDQDDHAKAALYHLGAEAAEEAGLPVFGAEAVHSLGFGEIGSSSQLAFGIGAAAAQIAAISKRAGARVSIGADDVATCFDKAASSQRLARAGLPTPRLHIVPGGFAAVTAIMDREGWSRVFVKLRHGAAAAGMMALVRHGDRWTATTTAVAGDNGRPCATRALRRITQRTEIARIIDQLAPLGLIVEQWLPKIGLEGQTVDLRMVVLGGEQVFPVLRSSPHPITNLHIGGRRGSADALAAKVGPTAWADIFATARQSARQFPTAQCLGIDMAVLVDGVRHAVLEVNAFGDHVRDFAVEGMTIHDALLNHVAHMMANRTPALAA